MLSQLNALTISNSSFLLEYLPILLFFGISLSIVLAILLTSYFVVPQKPYPSKNSPYESGFEHMSDASHIVNVRFYLVAILFLVFDVEIVFLYPWALTLKHLTNLGFWSMIGFIGVFLIGFIYELRKGVLEWY